MAAAKQLFPQSEGWPLRDVASVGLARQYRDPNHREYAMNLLASRGQLRASFVRWALLLVPAVLLAGFLSGQLAGSGPDNPWFASLVKPATYPPAATFGIVWSILYIMMGLAFALICSAWGARSRCSNHSGCA